MSKRRVGTYLGGSTIIRVPQWQLQKNLKEGQERHRRWVDRQLGRNKPKKSTQQKRRKG